MYYGGLAKEVCSDHFGQFPPAADVSREDGDGAGFREDAVIDFVVHRFSGRFTDAVGKL